MARWPLLTGVELPVGPEPTRVDLNWVEMHLVLMHHAIGERLLPVGEGGELQVHTRQAPVLYVAVRASGVGPRIDPEVVVVPA